MTCVSGRERDTFPAASCAVVEAANGGGSGAGCKAVVVGGCGVLGGATTSAAGLASADGCGWAACSASAARLSASSFCRRLATSFARRYTSSFAFRSAAASRGTFAGRVVTTSADRSAADGCGVGRGSVSPCGLKSCVGGALLLFATAGAVSLLVLAALLFASTEVRR